MAAAGKTAMAPTGDAPSKKTGPSLVIQIGALLLLTVAAAGTGWVSGGFLTSEQSGAAAAKAAPHAVVKSHKPAEAAEGGHGAEAPVSDTIIPLPSITTNLASPSGIWVRMELSMVLDQPQNADFAVTVQQDLLAYVRTVKMHEIEGASGFRHLKESLEERASIRSGGHVKSLLIKTLLFE